MRANIGVYNLGMRTKGGGEKLTLVLAEHLSLDHNVWLFSHEPVNIILLERYFDVDLSRVKTIRLDRARLLLRVLARVRGRRSPASPIHHFLQLRKLKLDVFINNTHASSLVCPAGQGIYMCMFPHQPASSSRAESRSKTAREVIIDWVDKYITGFSPQDAIDSYSMVTSISGYTREWVQKLWDRPSAILHPPCDYMGPATVKEKMLLHVGRFKVDDGTNEMHHKRQDTLLEAFTQMTSLHKKGWQLHFLGSVAPGEASSRFAAALVEKARGFPITFHFDADFDSLRDLYRRASIYWHATGYGHPADEYPDKQEHFGMATVEAMSAGAVPVVINSGGQKEIVTHEVDGLRWDDLPCLVSQTVRLVNDSDLLTRLSQQAILSSARFRRETFAANLDQVIGSLLSSSPGL
jgi:glycosyltransferase involved in cell wall biosynthesis